MAQPLKKFRTVFISDLHLGSAGCRSEDVIAFLGSFSCETLYLVGDIIDLWVMMKKDNWTQQHTNIIRNLLGKSKYGITIKYTPGNHDAFLRKINGSELGNIYIDDSFVHETADGKRFLIIHGDQFDASVKILPIAVAGAWAYEWYAGMNQRRRRNGKKAVGGDVKKRFKKAISVLSSFEEKLALQAAVEDCDGVICGHIHRPGLYYIEEVLYGNCGDWVENRTALVEHLDGRLELLSWDRIQEFLPTGSPPEPSLFESEVP